MFKFGNLDSFNNVVGRNTFDMSFGTNATFKMGKLYPVFCKEVLPRDTWKIDPKVAIQMMPTVFPLKTRLRCFVHFYYVKNRTLWKDWPKFINNSYGLGNENYNIVPPYIQHDYVKSLHGTGSLADFLGWPTALPFAKSIKSTRVDGRAIDVSGWTSFSDLRNSPYFDVTIAEGKMFSSITDAQQVIDLVGNTFIPTQSSGNAYRTIIIKIKEEFRSSITIHSFDFTFNKVRSYSADTRNFVIASDSSNKVISSACNILAANSESSYFKLLRNFDSSDVSTIYVQSIKTDWYSLDEETSGLNITTRGIDPEPLGDFDYEAAWWNGMQISALPFRAYESIYNAYYRNWQADPLMDDQNRPNYDTYVRNVEGGADTFDYDFYLRNYEKDMFTSAHPTPQMGVAPLVGITTLGQATFSYNGSEYSAQATFADDNETIQEFRVTANTPAAVGASATALTGISINDLRSVNALQRYLENAVRASYKYRNQIAAHFGAAPEFDAVDMPMFIGGIALELNQNVTTTTGDYTDSQGNKLPAGSPVSNGYFSYDMPGRNEIEKYCDEHGFIMGIMSIVPVPNYPQGLSKMWRHVDYMTYFWPEFGHLGYQPIRSNEIALFRQLGDKSGQVIPDTEIFGYQRSWYEYCGSNDEVHGEFRTTMRDYMLSRWFSEIPKLDPEFIGVDSSKLSYIFADMSDNDKFVGQLYFSAFAKRPIPEYGTPKLD